VTPAPVIVRCMDAAEVNSLTIISNDGGNIVNNIADSALTSLVLSGPTSLEIDRD
jgi:hypothetical protein